MYDRQPVTIGIIVFLALMLLPFFLNATTDAKAPKPELPGVERECIESAAWMRANHMQVLEDWRTEAVRHGDRMYSSGKTGKLHQKSLTNTCLGCHKNAQNFCDRCHIYAGVKPYCWECHVIPKEKV